MKANTNKRPNSHYQKKSYETATNSQYRNKTRKEIVQFGRTYHN